MADKKKKPKKKAGSKSRADSVRSAVENTISATADEINTIVARVRKELEDVSLVDELKRVRTEIDRLAKRVQTLELHRGGTRTTAAAKPAAAASKSAAAKPAARKPAARKPAARKPAARKPATTAARKPAARKPAARKPAARKPAARKPAARKPAGPGATGS